MFADEELPDYIMVMVANKKTPQQMTDDLSLFLGNNTVKFTAWYVQNSARFLVFRRILVSSPSFSYRLHFPECRFALCSIRKIRPYFCVFLLLSLT